jgi:hypothetical protein
VQTLMVIAMVLGHIVLMSSMLLVTVRQSPREWGFSTD